jgi:cytochrome c5
MKKVTTVLALSLVSILMVQCSPKKTTSTTAAAKDKTDEEIVAEIKSKYNVSQLEEGKVIFTDHCNKCHGYYQPETRTIAKWERVLPRMSVKSKLNEEESAKVRAYVLAHAKINK